MIRSTLRRCAPVLTIAIVIGVASIDPALAQQLKKAETGLENFLKFFQGNMGNIIVALAIIAAVFGIMMRRASIGTAAGIVVLAMVLANAKDLADQLDKWF